MAATCLKCFATLEASSFCRLGKLTRCYKALFPNPQKPTFFDHFSGQTHRNRNLILVFCSALTFAVRRDFHRKTRIPLRIPAKLTGSLRILSCSFEKKNWIFRISSSKALRRRDSLPEMHPGRNELRLVNLSPWISLLYIPLFISPLFTSPTFPKGQ